MTNASGIDIPKNVPSWKNIIADDFDTDAQLGHFIDNPAYSNHWTAYSTGTRTSSPWKTGMYDNSRLEVSESVLRIHIATITDSHGTAPRVAALRPKLSPTPPYGLHAARISICFRIPQAIPGYKIAWLLWPDSGDWPADGEIDFPEMDLAPGRTINGFMHRQDGKDGSDQEWASSKASAIGPAWHVATINWKPGHWRTPMCEFILDGELIKPRFTDRVPDGPMHSVLQCEPKLGTWAKPDPKVAGVIEIDWFCAYVPD